MPTLGDSYGVIADIRTMLREAVGHPDQTVLLPDGTVNRAMQRALDKLNADAPLVSIGTFPTVADQQVYAALPATAQGYRRVYWPMDNACAALAGNPMTWDPVAAAFGPVIDELGTRILIQPSEIYSVVRHLGWLRHLNGNGFTVVERDVYLDPVPGTSGLSVLFSYYTPRFASVVAVADGWREPFITLAEAYLHERLASGAGAVEQVSDLNEGTHLSTAGPRHALKLRDSKFAQYNESKPPLRPFTTFP